MRVVSNTSPLSYLVRIGEISILPKLFNRVLIPRSVAKELEDRRAPGAIRRWIATPPAWLEMLEDPGAQDAELLRLDPGEREAIALAEQVSADLVLLDERQARQVAQSRGLQVTGLLGLVARAEQLGFVDKLAVVEKLRATNFRIKASLLRDFLGLESAGE